MTPAAPRLAVYWPDRATLDAARSAYVLAIAGGHPARSWAAWVASVVRAHAELDPKVRAAAAATVPPPGRAPRGSATGTGRTVALDLADSDLPELIAMATRADLAAGRALGPSQFTAEALRIEVGRLRQAAGGTLPPAPSRLPNRASE